MKTNNLKYPGIILLTCLLTANVQNLSAFSDKVLAFSNDSILAKDTSDITEKENRWEKPQIKAINLDSIRELKKDKENYLKDLEKLNDDLKADKKELVRCKNDAKDRAKTISNERKRNAERKKMYKEDEKLLKVERKLRDEDLKAYKTERKAFRKSAKNMNDIEKNLRQQKLDEKEQHISELTTQWETKRQLLNDKTSKLFKDEAALDLREIEVKNRLRELDRIEQNLNIKQKQLNNEQKHVKMEIKKAKEMLK